MNWIITVKTANRKKAHVLRYTKILTSKRIHCNPWLTALSTQYHIRSRNWMYKTPVGILLNGRYLIPISLFPPTERDPVCAERWDGANEKSKRWKIVLLWSNILHFSTCNSSFLLVTFSVVPRARWVYNLCLGLALWIHSTHRIKSTWAVKICGF